MTGGGVVSGLLTAGWGPWRNVGGPICTEALGETGLAGWEEGGGASVGWGLVKDVTPDTVIGGYKHKHRLTSDCKRRAWLDCLGSGLTRLVCLFFCYEFIYLLSSL